MRENNLHREIIPTACHKILDCEIGVSARRGAPVTEPRLAQSCRCNERAIAIRRRHAGLREIPGAERRFLDWKAGFVVREPLRQRHCNFWRILVFAAA